MKIDLHGGNVTGSITLVTVATFPFTPSLRESNSFCDVSKVSESADHLLEGC